MLAGPRSLAATYGVSFDFLSSGYYNVLVHQVKIDGWFTLGSHHYCLDFPCGWELSAFRVYTSFWACSLDILNTHFEYLIIRSILRSILICWDLAIKNHFCFTARRVICIRGFEGYKF